MRPEFIKRYEDLKAILDSASIQVKQDRGREFERLINDIFQEENILRKASYYTTDNSSEQIDSAIRVKNKMFLVEVKWKKSNMAASELFSFIGKVENKLTGTLGVFISKESLSENFIKALNKGRRQSVIVVHGDDIDQWFGSNFKFEDYLDFVWEVISFDVCPHVSVRSYLDSCTPSDVKAKIETVDGQVVAGFINDYVIDLDKSEMLVLAKWQILTEAEKNSVYNYLITFYSKFYEDARKRFQYQTVDRINRFLEDISPRHDSDRALTDKYFNDLLLKNIGIYASPKFIEKFTRFYPELPVDSKKNFEQLFPQFLSKVDGSWEQENRFTELIEPIWKHLSDEGKKKLFPFYLEIYVSSDRGGNHPQKQFAQRLVNERLIPLDLMKDWLNERLKEDKKSYEELTMSRKNFISERYFSLAKNGLDMDRKKWDEFVLSVLT
jgi:hypothetical protein